MPHRHLLAVLLVFVLTGAVAAQVHYHEDGRPWKNQARKGPDAEVPGWFYNLGITGIRVQLMAEDPTHLLVKYVFPDSPAHGKVQPGDIITGAGGQTFTTPHRNGYGMEMFGPQGPIENFATALETAQGKNARGKLELTLKRDGKERLAKLSVGTRYGQYTDTYPADCKKSERILKELCDYLVQEQKANGSWGHVVPNTFAPLALMGTDPKRYRKAIAKAARFHADTTKAEDQGSLINWRYMAAAIVLAEYHLQTREKWVLPELEEIYAFIHHTQYMSLDQVNPRVKESHPRSYPKTAEEQHGGWGHNPGFEGYGPICMITGQGALAYAMLDRCGVAVPRVRMDAAFEFLARGTGHNGYVWYEDEVAGHERWADMGRTGATGLANSMRRDQTGKSRDRAMGHARCIGNHPLSFPDTHGSPMMGMGYAALAARTDAESFRKLMDANRWWFTLAQCHDGTFYYQPNRDNAGYGNNARILASSVTALVFSIPRQSLHLTGKLFQ